MMFALLTTSVPLLEGALCVNDPELFDPVEHGTAMRTEQALDVCKQCPAKTPCLEWALSDRTLVGILGGTTYPERCRLMNWKP